MSRCSGLACKIEAAQAKAKGDNAEYIKQAEYQVKQIKNIMSEFKEILEPYEVKDFEFQQKRLERLVKESGGGGMGG